MEETPMDPTRMPSEAGGRIPRPAIDQLFLKARTHKAWLPGEIPEETIRELYEVTRWGPTSSNTCPARIVFLRSAASKERLLPSLSPGNREKSRSAPVVALIAYDTQFYEKLPKLAPHADTRSWFAGKPDLIEETAFRNGSLQGGYFILAARALGLDCGPMSGFDAAKLEAEFFPDGRWKINFVCNLGHGDPSKLFPRAPRLDFEEACRVL